MKVEMKAEAKEMAGWVVAVIRSKRAGWMAAKMVHSMADWVAVLIRLACSMGQSMALQMDDCLVGCLGLAADSTGGWKADYWNDCSAGRMGISNSLAQMMDGTMASHLLKDGLMVVHSAGLEKKH